MQFYATGYDKSAFRPSTTWFSIIKDRHQSNGKKSTKLDDQKINLKIEELKKSLTKAHTEKKERTRDENQYSNNNN